MKKALKITLLTLLVLLVAIALGAWATFGSLIKGAASVKKLDEGFYYMEYKGDDGFDELLASGGGENAEILSKKIVKFLSKGYYSLPEATPQKAPYGCSALTVRTPEGDIMMGRNFDYNSGVGIILHSIPDNGYESISTFNAEFYGFGEGYLPEGFANQYMALSGLFFALDGINEKGFAIADLMAGDDVETHQRTGKPALTTSAALRYLLNKAANVDEALQLLRGIDMHSDIGSAHHYAMSDASGKSVVVEYVDNQMVVVESPAAANHYLCESKLNVGLAEGDHRYEQLCQRFSETGGVMSAKDLTEAIKAVSQPANGQFQGTIWTMTMDLKKPSVTYYSRRNFDKPFHFEISRTK